jgi:hypothetical protein
MYRKLVSRVFLMATFLAFGSIVFAQDATVKVRVGPSEAYIFVDGEPFAHGSQAITLPSGQHTIGVYHYGFVPKEKTVMLTPGENPEIVARLQKVPGAVGGSWGRVLIKGVQNKETAVFLNNREAEYFVGSVSEMDSGGVFKAKLVLPVGAFDLILVDPAEYRPLYRKRIEVRANKVLTVNVARATGEYKSWHGAAEGSLNRFGGADHIIAVAPVTGDLTIDKTDIKCGEAVTLNWNSTDAEEISIDESGRELPAKGQRTDSLTKTTTYYFRASGPGGIVTHTATVRVDPRCSQL